MPGRVPRRIATISVHTSPLEQPGTGDAGGLNVYVVEVAKRAGFGDDERMRRAFIRHLGVSPSEYRKRFSR